MVCSLASSAAAAVPQKFNWGGILDKQCTVRGSYLLATALVNLNEAIRQPNVAFLPWSDEIASAVVLFSFTRNDADFDFGNTADRGLPGLARLR